MPVSSIFRMAATWFHTDTLVSASSVPNTITHWCQISPFSFLILKFHSKYSKIHSGYIATWSQYIFTYTHAELKSDFRMQNAHIKHKIKFSSELQMRDKFTTWKHFQGAISLYDFLLSLNAAHPWHPADVSSAHSGSYRASIGYITYRRLTSFIEYVRPESSKVHKTPQNNFAVVAPNNNTLFKQVRIQFSL